MVCFQYMFRSNGRGAGQASPPVELAWPGRWVRPRRGYGSATRSEADQTGANIYALLNQRAPKKNGRREIRVELITMVE